MRVSFMVNKLALLYIFKLYIFLIYSQKVFLFGENFFLQIILFSTSSIPPVKLPQQIE